MIAHKDNYILIEYFNNSSLLIVTRNTQQLKNDEAYKSLIHIWREYIEKFKPKYQLVDYSNFNQLISPEMQLWINENLILPAIKFGLLKNAIIVSKDKFSQISINQTMDEEEGAKVFTKYFDNINDAKKWLEIL